MTDVLRHRGPDDRGTHVAPGVALGARRLSIVDIAGGHQPLDNEDGSVWAIQNGELYNHVDLRDVLAPDHVFRSRCDTEILPHLYERYGIDLAKHLRGKFALAVWDGRKRQALLARDRLGVKPLYYAHAGDLLVFASELKSVLASGLVSSELDYEAIFAYLELGFFPTPRTPLVGVSKLPPGQVLVADGSTGSVSVSPYWTYPRPQVAPVAMSDGEYGEGLLEKLDEAVRLRLMSDVPLGAMLSGGIDSSIIVALMARHMTQPVKTFSVGFAEDTASNELADARLVADAFGADHHELELSLAGEDVQLTDLVWYLDEPLADLSSVGFLALSRIAAQDVTVALAGQGADELLGGYSRHRHAALVGRWQHLPRVLQMAGLRVAGRGRGRVRRFAQLAAADPVSRYLSTRRLLGSATGELVMDGLAGYRNAGRRAVEAHAADIPTDPLEAMLLFDAQLGLVDDMLHYFDRASMAHSLEVRVPFLDHEVVEYCATLPPSAKVHGSTTKSVLKQAARGLIPDTIIDKPKVGFFNAAVDGWFRAQSQHVVKDVLFDEQPRFAQFLDAAAVRTLATDERKSNQPLLLAILMLEVWLKEYLPRATASEVRTEPLMQST
jgi:asparagine synthase (glutamine-hydrolysing)